MLVLKLKIPVQKLKIINVSYLLESTKSIIWGRVNKNKHLGYYYSDSSLSCICTVILTVAKYF